MDSDGEALTITRSNADEEVAVSLNFGGEYLSLQTGFELPPFGFRDGTPV